MKYKSLKSRKWGSFGFVIFVIVAVLAISYTKTAFSAVPPSPQLTSQPSVESAIEQENASDNAEEKAPLFLGQGEQRVLRIQGLKRYSVGGNAIHAHSLGDELLVKGVSPGFSDLWIWKSDDSSEHRTIRVEKEVGGELKPALARALGYLQEVEVLQSGAGVLLRGQIQSVSEAARISALIRGFPAEIHNEAVPSDQLLGDALIRLQNWVLATKNNSRLSVESSSGSLWVRGSIERPLERVAIEKQLRAIFPLVETELDSMPDTAPTIHFRVFLLELKKTQFHTIGLDWPAVQEGAFHVTTSAIQDALGLDVALNAMEGQGNAKILSSPELVVRAPGDAELFAGGELPIKTESRFFSAVSWKSFGLSLKLKVTHTTAERVRVEIFTEVSHLDPSLTQDKIPGIQANRMKTEVDAHYGVPLLLSGLLQQGTRDTARGLPFLRSIPVLGLLFGSDDYLNERSELVAILLPSSAPPPAPMARIVHLAPKGLLPPPRDWVSPQDEKNLKNSPDYPWNALR